MSVEAKIKFYKNKKFLGSYFVYNGDCDGRDTFWCSLSEWDGVMKLQMVNNGLLYFNAKDEEMFVFEEGEKEYDVIKKYINKKNKTSLTLRLINNKWVSRLIIRKKNKKIKKVNSFAGLESKVEELNETVKNTDLFDEVDEQIIKEKTQEIKKLEEEIKKLKEKIKELNKGNKRKLKTENNKLKKENKKLKEDNKQIHQLILEAKEESLLLPTQYHTKYKDGTDGVNWTMIKKATKILSDIREIINV